MTDKRDLLDAIECCRMKCQCDHCPLRDVICDDLTVDMINLPVGLVAKIEEEIAAEMRKLT
mgnify:CR=1 FL=1